MANSKMAKGSRTLPVAAAAFMVGALASVRTYAQSFPPASPLNRFDQPPPTTSSPIPYDPLQAPQDFLQTMPPFTAPLPSYVPLPPPIRVPEAVPPPTTPMLPFLRVLPARPTPVPTPAPFLLPERPDAAQAPSGGLRQGLVEYDRRVGMGSSGAVTALVRSAATGAVATGYATLEIVADPTGVIRTARVIDADRDRERWDDFAEELKSAQAPTIRTPELAHGVWMRLHLSALNELTSGHRQWWSPGVFFTFDIADPSAHKERNVRTRVLSEVWF